jgi:hypothetical protein
MVEAEVSSQAVLVRLMINQLPFLLPLPFVYPPESHIAR